MVARGEVREDLYYRLNGIRIDLPALRERADDVGLIAAQLLATLHGERQGGPRGVSVEVLERLEAYRWPGNVRELENVLRSATLFTESDVLTLDDLGDHPQILKAVPARGALPAVGGGGVEAAAWERMGAERIGLRQLQEKIEIECITRALAESGGNITRAAELLKMKRPRLSQLIKEHGITPGRTEENTCNDT